MRVIDHTPITDTEFISSTAPEADYTAWSGATAYVIGDRVILVSTHKIYECLVANTNFSPDVNLTGTTPKWLEVSSTNRWKMFDDEVGSATTVASPLTVVLAPGPINSFAALELVGSTATFSYKDAVGGTVVYTATQDLDASIVDDWYDYFFGEFEQLTEWVLGDLPSYMAPEVTITVTGSSSVACGVLVVGKGYELGSVECGASVGITDYSQKTTNAFGATTIVRRRFAKLLDCRMTVDNTDLNRTYALLASLRSTPCVWIGTDDSKFGPMVVYGFYKDFSIEVAYPNWSYCSLQVEGLT